MKIGLIEITQVALILLKAFGVVAWSWWLIFAPLLLTLSFVFATFALILVALLNAPKEVTSWQNLGKRLR